MERVRTVSEKAPSVVVRSVVWLPATVGLGKVSQQKPRTVTVESPYEVSEPEKVAVVSLKMVTGSVVSWWRRHADSRWCL